MNSRRVPRDCLPFPVDALWRKIGGPPADVTPGGQLRKKPRGTQQRRSRFDRIVGDAADCMRSLNYMWTGSYGHEGRKEGEASGVQLSAAQQLVEQTVLSAVEALGPPPADLCEGEAIQQLRLTHCYSGSGSATQTYDPTRVSLLEAGSTPVPLSVP